MTRSKLSTKALLLAGGIGLSVAAFTGLPAAAQEYCPDGLVPDPSYGCTDYGYPDFAYGYLPYGGYYVSHRGDHGFAHGMGGGFNHGAGPAHFGGDGFGHGMAGGFHGGGFGGGHR
jgi:hypothetical protein